MENDTAHQTPAKWIAYKPLPRTACCASWWFLGTLQISLTAGNFFFQACADQKWGQALERSFFQLVALFTLWIVCKITSSRHTQSTRTRKPMKTTPPTDAPSGLRDAACSPCWERHRYNYGWVCTECGYHGRHQIGREIHERQSWPEKCATWKKHFSENSGINRPDGNDMDNRP